MQPKALDSLLTDADRTFLRIAHIHQELSGEQVADREKQALHDLISKLMSRCIEADQARDKWYRRWKWCFGVMLAFVTYVLWFDLIPGIFGLFR